jgi:hypothetical protein
MVSTMRANGANMTSGRLNQELRATVSFAIAELRRARYMQDSITFVGEAQDDDTGDGVVNSDDWIPTSPYDLVAVIGGGAGDGVADTTDGECISYSYEHPSEGDFRTIAAREVDGVRGVFFGSDATASPGCDAVTNRISSREVEITMFAINFNESTDWVRITAEGRMRNGSEDFTRRYSEAVRIRSQVIPALPAVPPAP